MMESAQIIRQIAITAPPILIAIILHEVAHGFVAFRLGDPTAKMMGRLTLNPIAHIDIFGTVLMPLLLFVLTNGQFVFGYAKPVPINPDNFKNPKRDMAISAAAGPLTNLLLAFLSILLLKYVVIPATVFMSGDVVEKFISPLSMMLESSVIINVILTSFNLIPIPPLDGGRVLMGFLPNKQAQVLGKLEPYGMIIILVLVITGMARYIIMPLIRLFMDLISMV